MTETIYQYKTQGVYQVIAPIMSGMTRFISGKVYVLQAADDTLVMKGYDETGKFSTVSVPAAEAKNIWYNLTHCRAESIMERCMYSEQEHKRNVSRTFVAMTYIGILVGAFAGFAQSWSDITPETGFTALGIAGITACVSGLLVSIVEGIGNFISNKAIKEYNSELEYLLK